ncbi:MAG: NAD-dependent epimerase/dehydratase family protein, partial [Salinarimonas sp.]
MHVLVTGAAGMIGAKLARRLLADARLGDRAIDRLTLHDVVAPPLPETASFPVETLAADIGDPATAIRLVAGRPDVIVHLAAIVSGEAEADLEKGYRINLDGTRALMEAIRAQGAASGGGYRPRLVFASSVAVFGAPLPEPVPEDHALTPLTSYGTQK